MSTQLKTTKTKASVSKFINSIEDDIRRRDAKTILKMMKEATGEKPVMWGESIVGFGDYSYTRSDKKTFSWMLTAFSPRKQYMTVYLMSGCEGERHAEMLKKLGPHKKGKSCLYMRNLDKIDLKILKKLIAADYKYMKKTYGKKK